MEGEEAFRGEAERLLSLAPPLDEARRLYSSLSGAPWLGLAKGKRFWDAEDVIESLAKKWAKTVLTDLGFKHYQTVSRSKSDIVSVAVKAAGRGGYRLLVILVTDIYTVKRKKWGKMHIVLSASVYYASMARRNARIVDPILPRVKRRIIAPTRAIVIRRSLKSVAEEDPAPAVTPIRAHLNRIPEEGRYQVGMETLSARDPKGEKPPLTFNLKTIKQCTLALIEFLEYRAKYILFIPPIFIWKWGSYLIPNNVIYEEWDDEVSC